MQQLEKLFEKESLALAQKAAILLGKSHTLAQIEKTGALSAITKQPTADWQLLIEAKRVDLTLETLVAQSKYAPLFTDALVDLCLARLIEVGYYE